MTIMADTTVDATRRLNVKKQTLDDAYAAPANFLEIDVVNPVTHGVAKKRYTDYEVRMRTNLPVFKVKESSVRRRYSDFEWLRNELERDSKVNCIVNIFRKHIGIYVTTGKSVTEGYTCCIYADEEKAFDQLSTG
ncbi:sorting nexin 3 isoform X2 [Rhodnius prolixus]